VVTGPQLATAGLVESAPGPNGTAAKLPAGVPDGVVGAVAAVERDGLAALPPADFTAPPKELALAG